MKIAFIDPIGWDYTAEAVDERPLGGSQSALCYLTSALARRGHQVFLFNHTAVSGQHAGVQCSNLEAITPAFLRQADFDAMVILNSADLARQVQLHLAHGPRLVLWTQHAPDQPAVRRLADPALRDAHDAFVFVSDWQRDGYVQRFGISPARATVQRNAVAPAFTELFSPEEPVAAAKSRPAILAYTSTPFRGLDLLLQCFPEIRRVVSDARLKVFSSMRVYQLSPQEDQQQFGKLYEACRETEGVEYVGSVTQRELAWQLRRATLLAYPNTFPETSCIAVMEAMAAGCHVVTSRLGALPETTAGFAHLVPVTDTWENYKRSFCQACVEILECPDKRPGGQEDEKLQRQVAFANQAFRWDDRARDWETWLAKVRG